MKKLLTPLRVGLLVIFAGAVLFMFLTFVRKGGMSEDESVRVSAVFQDASGLTPRSRVRVAGIPVGDIEEIVLEGNRARLWMRISKDVQPRQNASVSKRSESLLGDYMIDLYPGSEPAALLTDGQEIQKVVDAQGMDAVFSSLSDITQDIKAVTGSLRGVLSGDESQASLKAIVDNLAQLTEATNSTVRDSAGKLDSILANVQAVTADVRSLTAREQESVANIVENVEAITRDIRGVMGDLKGAVDGQADGGAPDGGLGGDLVGLRQTLARLDRSMANIEEVTEKLKNGEGAVGALLTDERLAQKLTETVEDVADFAGRLTGLQLEVGVRVDYLAEQNSSKTFLHLRLTPKPDKYYLIEVVDDPRGSVETVYVQQNPPAAGEPAVQKQTITRETYKFSAQFAKRYSWLTLRFGLIESTGGVGADVTIPLKLFTPRWIEEALVLKVDAFNFSIEALRFPRLRATLRFTPFEHFYVVVGMDDILNPVNRDGLTNRLISGRDFFAGVGVYFTDGDLKSLLPVVPTP